MVPDVKGRTALKTRHWQNGRWGAGIAIALALVIIVVVGLLSGGEETQAGGSSLSGSGYGPIAVPPGVHPHDVRVLGVGQYSDWFFSMQPGVLVKGNYWGFMQASDQVPVYLTPLDTDRMVIGFEYSDYNYRMFLSATTASFLWIRMSDGTVWQYVVDQAGQAKRDNTALFKGVPGHVILMLINEPDSQGTVPAPWRTVIEAQFTGFVSTANTVTP
jgi:hypothetical protein